MHKNAKVKKHGFIDLYIVRYYTGGGNEAQGRPGARQPWVSRGVCADVAASCGGGNSDDKGNLDERHSHGVRQAVHEARPEVVVERLEEELRPAAER